MSKIKRYLESLNEEIPMGYFNSLEYQDTNIRVKCTKCNKPTLRFISDTIAECGNCKAKFTLKEI